ncbi:MAG: LD-carboxypeptidase [Bacteroidia bacterium]|nr:LD-carboxypeptidase [Bacteroidia bacterium]
MTRIAIVAPSGAICDEYLVEGVSVLRGLGFDVTLMPHVGKGSCGVFSATDEERAEDLYSALTQPGIDIVLCTRGGYGAVRTLQKLPQDLFSKIDDRLVVGFSDITAIHSMLTLAGRKSIHGPMLKHIATHSTDSLDIKTLLGIFSGEGVKITLANNTLNRYGQSEGVLVGGNLSILYSLRGTPADVLSEPEGKILFIEDLAEYNYHIDRMMQNLRYSGVLGKISGLIVGQFTDIKEGRTPFGASVYEVIRDAMEGTSCPILFGYPAGHQDDINCPLRLGARCRIDGLTIEN